MKTGAVLHVDGSRENRYSTPCRIRPSHSATNPLEQALTVASWQSQWRHLALQASAAESDSQREMQNSRVLSREQIDDLRAVKTKLEDDHKRWVPAVWEGLARVRKHVNVLEGNLYTAAGMEHLGTIVRGAEHELRVFGEKTRLQYEELATEELALTDTLQTALTRFEGWCSQESALSTPIKLSAAKRKSSTSQSRLSRNGVVGKVAQSQRDTPLKKELDQIVANMETDGGLLGGWSQDDHDTFLRVLVKFRGKTGSAFLHELQQLLAHLAHEVLIEHVAWSVRNEDREVRKREIVDEWKEQRAAATTRDARTRSCSPAAQTIAARKCQADERTQLLEGAAERKRLVLEWRSKLREDQTAEESRARCREEEARERNRRKQLQQKQMAQGAIETFKQQRLEEKRMREAQLQTTHAVETTSEDRVRIDQRNEDLLRKRVILQQAKQHRRESFSFDPAARVGSDAYLHVESRLRSHTEEYVEKVRDLKVDMNPGESPSKYRPVHGNFAHQGVMRNVRSSPQWRGRLGG